MHCINIIVIKNSELRDIRLDALLEDKKINLKCVELPQGILAFPTLSKKDVCKLGEGITFVELSTDYFGGAGEQVASCFETFKSGEYYLYKETYSGSINNALAKYGVKRIDDKDEFDSIDLGRRRSNNDYIKDCK